MRLLPLFFALIAFVACTERAAYKSYHTVSIDGWDAADSIVFSIDSLPKRGTFIPTIGLRSSAAEAYEFRTLYLEVKQRWQGSSLRCDTLACELREDRGEMDGKGTFYYQYEFPLKKVSLQAGQSGRIVIRHIMRKEILSGISDIGFLLLPPP